MKSSDNSDDLLFLLEPGSGLMRHGEIRSDVYSANGREYFVGDSSWAGFPDLLVRPDDRCWIGLAYYVPNHELASLPETSRHWNSSAYRVSSVRFREASRPIPDPDAETYLEIFWDESLDHVEHELAQLDMSSVSWVWDASFKSVMGIVLFDASETATEHGVLLPESRITNNVSRVQ